MSDSPTEPPGVTDFKCQSIATLSCDGHLLRQNGLSLLSPPFSYARIFLMSLLPISLLHALVPPSPTPNRPLPHATVRDQTSLGFGSEHIWRRTCKRKGHRRQSTRSGHGSYECFASNHETTVCSHTAIEHHRSAPTTNPCIQRRTDASCPHCGTKHSWAGLRFPRGSHEYRESSVGKGSSSGAGK
jgi:hypothetical protein